MSRLDIKKLSASEIAEAVRSRKLSAVEVCERFLSLAMQDKCGSYITVMWDEAFRAARRVDEAVRQGEVDLALAGVPVAIKDNICTSGVKTTCASRFFADFVPSYSATAYSRLLSAGAVPIGKTNMDELAVGSDGSTSYFGECTNPLDKTRTPGGSSSGAASCIAAGSSVLSLGSDTGGSARIPATFCGIVAMKPTHGGVSRYGLVGMAPSLEQICPMTKSVADNKLLFDVISGYDVRDMTTYGYRRSEHPRGKALKVGVFLPDDASSLAVTAVQNAISALEEAGAVISQVTLPYLTDILGVYYTLSAAEASSNLARFDGIRYGYRSVSGDVTSSRVESMGWKIRERLSEGAYVLTHNGGEAYVRALGMRESLKNTFRELFSQFDIILTPMTDVVATKHGRSAGDADRYAVYANISGAPSVTVPTAKNEKGLPIGVQLMGSYGCEDVAYYAAEIVERVSRYDL